MQGAGRRWCPRDVIICAPRPAPCPLESTARRSLLLARAQPGHPLVQLCYDDDERATSIAAALARNLARPAPDDGAAPPAWLECAALLRRH